MPPKIKAIIFDLDGVLINTEPLWVKAYGIWLVKYKAKNDPEIYKKMIGRGLKENMVLAKKHLGVKGNILALANDLRSILYELVLQKRDILMPGVLELLPKMTSLKLAVATGGHNRRGAEKMLLDSGIRKYFKVVISSDDVKHGKPAPDVYIEAAKQLKVKRGECLVIEDSVNGVESGKAARMYTIGVNASLADRNALVEAGADEVIESLKEFKP